MTRNPLKYLAKRRARKAKKEVEKRLADLMEINVKTAVKDNYAKKTWRYLSRKPVRIGKTPGRNAPCPCGSGVKYKKCCLRHL